MAVGGTMSGMAWGYGRAVDYLINRINPGPVSPDPPESVTPLQEEGVSEILEVGDGVEGTYSVGDATFMDSDDSFLEYIQNRVDVDANGYYDIIAHGTANGIQITHNGQHIIVDHRTAARLIQNANGYNGQGIRLLSCNTGALDNGFAQNLANQLNVEVYAPTNYLWATQDGNYFVAGMTNQGCPNMSELGMFRVFIPGGSQ